MLLSEKVQLANFGSVILQKYYYQIMIIMGSGAVNSIQSQYQNRIEIHLGFLK